MKSRIGPILLALWLVPLGVIAVKFYYARPAVPTVAPRCAQNVVPDPNVSVTSTIGNCVNLDDYPLLGSQTDNGPRLNQAWAAAQVSGLPLLIPPGNYNFSTPVVWVGSPQPQIWARGATLTWTGPPAPSGGLNVAVRYGAPLTARNNGGWIDGLCVVNGTSPVDLNTVGLVIQNTSYAHIVDMGVQGFGTQLRLRAESTTTGYNLFERLGLSGGQVGLNAIETGSSDACLNANQFEHPIIGGTAVAMIQIGPAVKWPPSVLSFHGGMFEGVGGALLTAGQCDVIFDNCYYEASGGTPFSVTAPAKNVTFVNCRGTGTGQSCPGYGVWSATN